MEKQAATLELFFDVVVWLLGLVMSIMVASLLAERRSRGRLGGAAMFLDETATG